jgi:cobalt transporter subunit CbtA
LNQFRKLTLVSLVSGTVAGLALAVVQHFAVVPLIETAEIYETAAQNDKSNGAHEQEDQGWHPAKGWQRNSLTVLTTLLTGIGFAAILFGMVGMTGKSINLRSGALWGLAAFACFGLAPALSLPPRPPGVAVAAVSERQLWWVATAIATAVGLWLIIGQRRNWLLRLGGVASLLLPHIVGAPVATGDTVVPARLLQQFKFASLATTAMFWLLLGTIGGFIYDRNKASSR